MAMVKYGDSNVISGSAWQIEKDYSMSKVAFLGMGVMGYPMAGHIAAAGHEVTVYNRTAAKSEAWAAQHGGAAALTPAAAAADADFVFCCVGDDPDVLSVALGDDGAIPAMKSGAVFIDNSTVSADVARQVYDAAKAMGVHTLDAPVSGGQAGAENGKLTVMVGGDDAAFAAAVPLMECYGARVVHMGGAGKGQQAKMVNQICIAGLVQALSEGLSFAMDAGLDTTSCSRPFPAARRNHGKWLIAVKPWSKANLISALPLIGCARICGFVWKRPNVMALICP
jgi:3-hydroxyisobutyrate dehydrogenase